MQIIPLNLDSVLLLLHNSKLAYCIRHGRNATYELGLNYKTRAEQQYYQIYSVNSRNLRETRNFGVYIVELVDVDAGMAP